MTFREIMEQYDAAVFAAQRDYREKTIELFAGMTPVEIAAEIIESYIDDDEEPGYYGQVFRTRGWDHSETLYSGKREDGGWWYVHICSGYGYFDVTGLSSSEYDELKERLTGIKCEW